RHTRFSRDWSSDVCSSDLPGREGQSVMRPWREAEADRVLTERTPGVVPVCRHGGTEMPSTGGGLPLWRHTRRAANRADPGGLEKIGRASCREGGGTRVSTR